MSTFDRSIEPVTSLPTPFEAASVTRASPLSGVRMKAWPSSRCSFSGSLKATSGTRAMTRLWPLS